MTWAHFELFFHLKIDQWTDELLNTAVKSKIGENTRTRFSHRRSSSLSDNHLQLKISEMTINADQVKLKTVSAEEKV